MKRLKNIVNPVYDKYLEIPFADHQQKIRFFERHHKELKYLPKDIFNDLFVEYTKSLYQVREIGQFLKIVDTTIELIIIENIESYSGDNLYEELLYMKASALYYQLKHKQAEYVLNELIKIQGASKKTKSLFLKNAVESLRYNDQYIRSMIILLIILSGITIGFELLLVRSFYPEHTAWIEKLRITFLVSGILLFVFQEVRVRVVSAIRFKRILNNSKS